MCSSSVCRFQHLRILASAIPDVRVWLAAVSGFVVTGSLLRQRAPTAGVLLLDFYVRRVKRLWPALTLTVLVSTLALSTVVPDSLEDILHDMYTSGQLALLGVANIEFATRHVDYWTQGLEGLEYNPFTHTWSLGVEEQAPAAPVEVSFSRFHDTPLTLQPLTLYPPARSSTFCSRACSLSPTAAKSRRRVRSAAGGLRRWRSLGQPGCYRSCFRPL